MRTPREEQSRWAARVSGVTTKDSLLLAESNDAEGSATVVVVAGGEEELIGVAVRASHTVLAELNGPDIVDLDGLAAGIAERAEESARLRIKGVDAPARSVIRDEKRICASRKPGNV